MGKTAAERRAADLGKKRPWSERDAREALAAWEASGGSMTAFGERVGIVPQRLHWWRSRLSSTRQPESMLPVEVMGSGPAVVLTTKGGTRIEVSSAEATSAEWVATVVRAMGERRR